MSKINENITEETKSKLFPKGKFGQFEPLKVRSLKPWFGAVPKSSLGWSDKSLACLGLKPETSVIWVPLYFDEVEDNRNFQGFAKKNGVDGRTLGALVIREWYYKNQSEIDSEADGYSEVSMDLDTATKKLEALQRSQKKMEAMILKLQNPQSTTEEEDDDEE